MRIRLCAAVICAVAMSSTVGAEVRLENARWQVTLDPATLASVVTPNGLPGRQASIGGKTHVVSMGAISKTEATWTWDDADYRLSVRLDGDDMLLTVRARRASELVLVRQPAEAMGRGLLLPLAEGHYIPRGEAMWQQFLTGDDSSIDMAEGLSLPLWSNDLVDHSLTWIMPDTLDNRLDFTSHGDAVAVTATHRFTPLTVDVPLTMILHLGPGQDDLLAGAKRYRRWLIDNGRFEAMSEKLKRTPATASLLGATHVYLWGNGLLAPTDVVDWQALGDVLRGDAPLARSLRDHLEASAHAVLGTLGGSPGGYEKRTLIDGINEAFASRARQAWMTDNPDPEAFESVYSELRNEAAKLFDGVIATDPVQWGSGLSVGMVKRLREAGLQRLWLGLGDGWEGGLWHPEAVAAAVKAGFLIAPYDSYETALAQNGDPSWVTSHLGKHAFDQCGILRADGRAQPGFAGKGRYTDPRCMQPFMQRRIAAIHKRADYNSWFLDAYATAMSFESHRKGATMTRQQNVDGYIANMRWVQEGQGLVAGSEGGNAFSARGFSFAHGMQTPVIGWQDVDMGQGKRANRRSAHFVGAWYPPHQPAIFFKPVPLKAIYRTVHFDPRFRLPLYQAVFHDSVVTTHHWLYDNLKLTNVRVESELTQLLYNVPGLFHISASSLGARLPFILRQDAFFRPLHRRLATQAMTGFAWLDADRLLQRTSFADGTRLMANFSNEDRTHDGKLYARRSVTAVNPDGSSSSFVTADTP